MLKKCEPLGCNDHNQIYYIIKVKGERNREISYRKTFHKGRYKDLREYLAKIYWNKTLKNKIATVEKNCPVKKTGETVKEDMGGGAMAALALDRFNRKVG